MHASNVLKAVLKPRSLSSTTSGRKQSLMTPQNEVTTKGKHISSLDHSLPSATSVIARKSSHSSSPPVKVTCLCSPTNHPGSFRCRHHRTGNPLGSASASSSKASGASSRAPAADSRQAAHMIRANGMHNLPSLPGPPPSSSLARSPLGRTSRLNPMVASGEAERDIVVPFVNEEPVRISSSTVVNNGSSSFTSASLCMAESAREIYSANCQTTSKKATDAFDRSTSMGIYL